MKKGLVYQKTKWVDNRTPVNAANLNKIEDGIDCLFNNTLSPSQLKEGNGIKVEVTKDKDIEISAGEGVLMSGTIKGIEYVFEQYSEEVESEETNTSVACTCPCCITTDGIDVAKNKDIIYYVLDKESKKLKYILLNGVKIFEA